jgi:polyphosphate kinase 2 (PPK2 family)
LQERIDNPKKHWKHNPDDFEQAKHWDKYRQYYEEVFEHCNAAPWTIIPADQNWYKEYCIAKLLFEKLSALNLSYPSIHV